MKKTITLLFAATCIAQCLYAQNTFPSSGSVGIGTTSPNASSLLEVKSTTKGILIPRMTQAQRNLIGSPSTGLLIFQTDVAPTFYWYTGSGWKSVGGAGRDLANLVSTKINLDLLPVSTNSLSLGSSSRNWKDLYLSGSLYQGANRIFSSDAATGNLTSGINSLPVNTSGNANTAYGYYSMNQNMGGFSNTAFGSQSLGDNVSGYFNTAVGQASLAGNGNDNTAVGRYAFVSLSTGNGNTALGSAANISDGTLSNVTLLGFFTTATASNSVQIGNNAVTSVKAANNVTIVSDGRFKKNIKQNVPGLAFINALVPVTYNYDIKGLDVFNGIGTQKAKAGGKIAADASLQQYAEAVTKKEKVVYTGFVAQEVEKAALKLGYDFSGVYKPQNDKDTYGLSYAEFVVPVVKAVQELSAQNDALKADNAALLVRLEKIEALLKVNSSTTTGLSDASLEQNLPNPFNEITVINYTLPQQYRKAMMTVTDVSGKVIKEINISGVGKGKVQVDASSLSAGVYQYRLYVDGKQTETKQMILAR